MRAIVISQPGPPSVLRMADVPDPDPGPDQIRVRIAAAGVNRADLLQRIGGYPPPPGSSPQIPGLEYAGRVDAVGSGVDLWRPGDRVMGLVGGGGYAEYVVVHSHEALPVPAALSLVEAAAVPEVFLTAHDAMFSQMRLRPGDALLIHAVGSGVGTAAVQLAATRGIRTLGTSRSARKLERAGELGLDVAIDVGSEDFVAAVERATEGRGVNGVLDLVGGDYLRGNLAVLAPFGWLVIVGLVAGANSELDMRAVLRKRLTIRGTVMRNRSLEEKIAVAAAFHEDALALFAGGALRPVIDEILPMHEAPAAHHHMEENRNFGKIVLRWMDG